MGDISGFIVGCGRLFDCFPISDNSNNNIIKSLDVHGHPSYFHKDALDINEQPKRNSSGGCQLHHKRMERTQDRFWSA